MYPNYCFRKPPTDYGYEVMYVPKSCSENHSHLHSHHSHSHSRSRSRPRQPSKHCCDDLNEQVHRPPARSVEFRLPTTEQQRYRQHAGMEQTEREYRQKQQQQQHQQQQQQQVSSPSEPPSSAASANREMQESCTDFFNIIYENVLEAVHGAVEHMVSKHFEQILCRVDQLAADLSEQEAQLKQLGTDLMGKLAEQTETSINQFKFIAQMLIDNQTIFYRALSQRRHKHNSKEEPEDTPEQKLSSSTERVQRQRQEFTAPNQLDSPRVQQHQLWQQQDSRIFPQLSGCRSCNHKSTLSDHADYGRPPAIVRRMAKGVTTASMPDLHRSSTFPPARTVNSKSKAQPVQRVSTPTTWSENLRKCRCQRPPAQERAASPRRRLRTTGKVSAGCTDEVRSHR